jgi:RNA polymerase sigma-70 factor, ECF subfamily
LNWWRRQYGSVKKEAERYGDPAGLCCLARPRPGRLAGRAVADRTSPDVDPLRPAAAPSASAYGDDLQVIEALRRGDEAAFEWLVGQHHAALVRLALRYVSDPAVAQEVVQETWLHVFQGIGRFAARSSLRTWIFSILGNRARKHGARENRSVPFAAVWGADLGDPAVPSDRFRPSDAAVKPDAWASPPPSWGDSPEIRVLSAEVQAVIENAIKTLPLAQREVVTLRDVDGWTADEVCRALSISASNQRVLLHRARSTLRNLLETYLRGT